MGRAVHRNAQSQANLNGDAISIAGNGYFNVDVTITFNGAVGDAEISLYKDGYQVPGAIAVEDNDATYLKIALAFLNDKDAPEGKAYLYWKAISQGR